MLGGGEVVVDVVKVVSGAFGELYKHFEAFRGVSESSLGVPETS